MGKTPWLLAAALAIPTLGCHSESRRGGSDPVKLNPRWTPRALGQGEAPNAAFLDALEDRRLSTRLDLFEPLALTARFDSPVKPTRVKVHGAHQVRVEVSGRSLAARTYEGGWQDLALPGHASVDALEIRLIPTARGASADELEVWGQGRPAAPRSPAALSAVENPGAFENLWRAPAEPSTVLLEPGESSACASLAVSLPGEPRAIRRAYLTYRGKGLKRPIVLRRSVNGFPFSGGFWMGPTASARAVLDEIPPEQLGDSNAVSLCLPEGATSAVEVEGVALVAELDNGTNILDRDSQLALGEAWDGDVRTSTSVGELAIGFLRPNELGSVWLHVDAPSLALDAVSARSASEERSVATALQLEPGMHLLPIEESLHAVEELALRLRRPARPELPAGSLAEIGFSGSPAGNVIPRLVITYPPDGEHFGGLAFVSGFVDGAGELGAAVEVRIDGQLEPGGAYFSRMLKRDDRAQGPWTVSVEASLPGGRKLSRTLLLDRDASGELLESGGGEESVRAADILYGGVDQIAAATIGPEGGEVKLGERVKLLVPKGALNRPTPLSVQRKAPTSVPPLDPALLNVSAPPGAGYRFKPKGQKFSSPVKVFLPYSASLLPAGMSPEEIRTWYYDESIERWKALPRVAIHRGTSVVESETSHFTFMINAVLVLPDSPGPASFNPNALRDLKAADPSAGIDLIEPPSGNNQGTARTSFPIRIPPGRGAFVPDVRLVYDSSGGNGWVGVGWDVPVSRIEVDTRFGVPWYDGTERYLLDGDALVSVKKETCLDGASAWLFARRAERDFLRIRRCGSDPRATAAGGYHWEVTDKQGTTFVYGTGGGRLSDYQAGGENIARWMLERVVDANGNLTEYEYQEDSEGTAEACAGGAAKCEPFRQLYLSAIQYTGTASATKPTSGGTSGSFRVEFLREFANGLHLERPDVVTSARTGFKVVTRNRLASIRTRYKSLIREYALEYSAGDFGKSLLSAIIVRGEKGTEFYRHELDYELHATDPSQNAFAAPVEFASGLDDQSISQSDETGANIHAYIGLGLRSSKMPSAGLKAALDVREKQVRSLLLDLNGDRLPDRVFENNGAFFVQYNQATPQMASFAQVPSKLEFLAVPPPGDTLTGVTPPVVSGLPGLGLERGNSVAAGLEAHIPFASLGLSAVFGNSWSPSSIFDADGDGLPDYVSSGNVFFQKERRVGCPTGSVNCRPPGEIGFSQLQLLMGADASKLAQDDSSLKDTEAALKQELHPEDAILQWIAPFAGDVSLYADLRKKGSGGRDGALLRLYKNGTELQFTVDGVSDKGYTLQSGDIASHQLNISKLTLAQGDRLYFHLSTLEDFPVDGNNKPVDEVELKPVIRYLNKNLLQREPAGGKVFEFSLMDDFRLAGDPAVATTMGRGGKVEVVTAMSKPASITDDVRVCLQTFALGKDVTSRECDTKAGDVLLLDVAFDRNGSFSDKRTVQVAAGDQLVFRQEAHTQFDPASVSVSVDLKVKDDCDSSGACTPLPLDVQKQLTFPAPVFVATHMPARSPVTPWDVADKDTYEIGGTYGGTAVSADIHYVITINGVRHFKATTPSCAKDAVKCVGAAKIPTEQVSLNQGDRVTFEHHSEVDPVGSFFLPDVVRIQEVVDPKTGDIEEKRSKVNVTAVRTFDIDVGQALVNLVFRSGQPISGGYRGWRFLQWNGSEAFDESKLQTNQFQHFAGKTADQVAELVANQTLDPASAEASFLRLFVPMVPAPRGVELSKDPLWRGSDGYAYVGKGVIHAGRKGGYGFGDPQAGGGGGVLSVFKLGRQVRTATSRSFTAAASPVVLSGSASLGYSSARSSVMDMNGDGVADVVTADSVSQTTAALGRGKSVAYPSEQFALTPIDLVRSGSAAKGISHSDDASLTLGLGIGAIIERIRSDGSKVQASTGTPPLPVYAGVGVAFNRQRTTEELLDVNGDGLPDKAWMDAGQMRVRLNLGNRFAAEEDTYPVGPWQGPIDRLGKFIEDYTDLKDKVAGLGLAQVALESRRKLLEALLPALDDPNALAVSSTASFSGNAGVSIDIAANGGGAGRTIETSLSSTAVGFMDVTGDGLPDYVKRGVLDNTFRVQVNLGHSFATEQAFAAPAWEVNGSQLALPCFRLSLPNLKSQTLDDFLRQANAHAMRAFVSHVVGGGDLLCQNPLPRGIDTLSAYGVHSADDMPSVGAWFSVAIPIVPILGPYLIINPGADISQRQVGFELGMQDIDGDGLVDHVLKPKDARSVYARVNQLGGGNLLKSVKRPLGGSFELDYLRLGNTVSMPESRFVLHTATVSDGLGTTRGHVATSEYEYADGRYDRTEKEFLGFATVRRKNPDGSKVAQSYRADSYFTKGLLSTEELSDKGGALFSRTTYSYDVREVAAAQADCLQARPYPLVKETHTCAAKFAALLEEKREFFEGKSQAGVVTRREYEYDCKQGSTSCYGNVVSFEDEFDDDKADDVVANVQYTDDVPALLAKHIVGKALALSVTDRAGKLLRKRLGQYDANGNLQKLTSWTEDSGKNVAQTELGWTLEGNLDFVLGPPNKKGQRYSVAYSYDKEVRTHIASSTDSFGHSSTAEWDVRHGEVLQTIDVNGNCTLRQLDGFGRLEALFGPEEAAVDASGRCTVRGAAQPAASITYVHGASPAYAATKNKLPPKPSGLSNSPGSINTAVFLDGLGRVIQTKKTAEVKQGAGATVGTAVGCGVSGHLLFDEMGRVEEQGQAIFSQHAEGTYVGPPGGQPRNPTKFKYDVLGRTVETEEPGGRKTAVAYGFGLPSGRQPARFSSEVTDAEGKKRLVYRDVADRVVAVEERMDKPPLTSLTTHYLYNPLGELVSIEDAKGNTTTAGFDLLGRRTSLSTPDNGLTEYAYDAAGNLTKKVDENLRLANQAIFYEYDFNRLLKVNHPVSADVAFEYGAVGAKENGAGRVVKVVDEAGEETRGYDKLGNVSRATRTVVGLRPGAKSSSYTTKFEFDGFGRMLSLTYPDGEVLRYEYDAGGLLRAAFGQRGGQKEAYLVALLYDEFGQRVLMDAGNGVRTEYEYDSDTRRLEKLSATLPSGRAIQALAFTYDGVGNVKDMVNALGAATQLLPGAVEQHFRYDDLYRLVWGSGRAEVAPNTVDSHESTFEYDDIHNLTRKKQSHLIVEPSGNRVRHAKTNHDFAYLYAGKGPHAASRIGDADIAYDASGNVKLETAGPTSNPRVRRLGWTEENWLREVVDGGEVTSFLYDGSGGRVVKRGKYGETTYVGQFYSVKGAAYGTKHVFAGQTRLATKVDFPPAQGAGASSGGGAGPDRTNPRGHLIGIPRACVSGGGKKWGLADRCPDGEPEEVTLSTVRPQTYYYHPDHLGSSNYLTDEEGEVFEHVEYFPYGEAWREDGPRKPVSEFRFTGKPVDPETELTYFGARYYDSKRARWVSPEPLRAMNAPSPAHLADYSYAQGNPVRNLDPDGRCSMRADGTVDCLSVAYAQASALEAEIGQAWGAGDYGAVNIGVGLYAANSVLGAIGLAENVVIAAPYNAGWNTVRGFSEGDYEKALVGSAELASLG
ncbi:MAG: hypothetical protein HYZ28_23540, partial [Myxococcales bacterium]|nr:hypothetical protein [Myxococcales bacterium]